MSKQFLLRLSRSAPRDLSISHNFGDPFQLRLSSNIFRSKILRSFVKKSNVVKAIFEYMNNIDNYIGKYKNGSWYIFGSHECIRQLYIG